MANSEIYEEELTEARAEIFYLLRLRLRSLREARTRPVSSYIGQDYVEDVKRLNCTIHVAFLFPGEVDVFDFWFHGMKVHGQQHGGVLAVTIHRKISAQLWDDLRLINVGQNFIIGYVTSLMPLINRRLVDNRYLKGHLLSRTFAVFEAVEIGVAIGGRYLRLDWPPMLPSFPPTSEMAGIETPLYIRDYIDSIDAYFRSEYDDSVRRVITATENFLIPIDGKAISSSEIPAFEKLKHSSAGRLKDSFLLEAG